MGYRFNVAGINELLAELGKTHLLFAPKMFEGEGAYSDTDSVRYGEVHSVEQIELTQKSSHSFKEILLPISETLFYYTEEETKEAGSPQKEAIVFLRSCDLHALKRLDEIYLNHGAEDYFYKRLREHTKFILLGCATPFDNCFCVDMGSNISTSYDASMDLRDEDYYMDCQFTEWVSLFETYALESIEVFPDHATKTKTHVNIPEGLTVDVAKSKMWEEYDTRCIGCGRCNFSCPTCTCFTMQDIFYSDNGKVGERRRVWASCMVDGYTDVAGGGNYRKQYGQRMRFKVLHKVLDYKQRFGYHMCVGCGRCDDVCPEYISFSHAINKLDEASKEEAVK